MTVVFIDLDEMKEVNDRMGHAGGDELLRSFAGKVSDSLRDEDLCARVGGDEFVVVLPDTDHRQAMSVVERLQLSVHEISASYGVATFLSQPPAVEDLISAADSMMYVAKRAGGNRVVGGLMPEVGGLIRGLVRLNGVELTHDLLGPGESPVSPATASSPT